MNYIDGILIAILLAMAIVGSKKGMLREAMAFIVILGAIIVSINYLDQFAIWVNGQLSVSPLVSAMLSFIILLAGSYLAFKLLGKLFYKMADLKKMGQRDQMGGALVGFLRGWLAASFITLVTFMMPMPDAFYISFGESFLGPAVAKTIPLMFDGTSAAHPKTPSFMSQMENTLLSPSANSSNLLTEDRQQIHRVMRQLDIFFNPST